MNKSKSGAFRGCLGSTRSQQRFFGVPCGGFVSIILQRLDRFWAPFGRPLDFERSLRLVLLHVIGAAAKTKENMYFVPTIAEIGKCKTTKT